MPAFQPKLLTVLREGYSKRQFVTDLGAGLVVGIVALPLAIAFAIASGVTPERGLYTAIIAGFLIAALGGSRVQIGGPTGAFVVIVAGIVAQHGVAGLTVATIMAGVILISLGLARLGGVIKFIPHPIVTGFTSGIAVIIFSSQMRDLLGLDMVEVPSEFFAKWAAYGGALPSADWPTIAVAGGTLAILLFWPRVSHRVPSPFVALVVATVSAALLHLPVETIGSRFGELDFSLPAPSLPAVNEAMLVGLVGPAITIALLGAIESLLSAVVADGMIGGARHRSNTELVAQGVANVITPIFGGIPATGAIARTATNVKNGGRTPIAGIVHAVTLLAITLFAGRYAAMIPMAALAGILVVVAYHMSEWRTFQAEIRTAPRSDSAVMVTTFLLTVMVDLTVALAVGMVLAAFLFMKRMAEVSNVQAISREMLEREEAEEASEEVVQKWRGLVPRGVEVYDINGPFFFGAAETFGEYLNQVSGKPKSIVLDLEGVPAMDSTGLRALRTLVERRAREGVPVFVVGLQDQPKQLILRSPLADLLGRERLDLSAEEAVALIREYGFIITSREARIPTQESRE